MRAVSSILIGLGIIVLILGLVNHFVIKANPVAHTSTITAAVGAVLLVVGVLGMMLGGRSSASV
jgi:uncharacterized membrane protein HdeD (DUF308 family)